MFNSMLKIKNLSKEFERKPVIKNLNMEIKAGENVCLFAPSGTGKTTLIKIINGLIKNYSGSINIKTNNISTVFQSPDLFWYKTVRQNILFPFKIKDLKIGSAEQDRYREWLKKIELTNQEHLYPSELSGGMKQKVALARGFIFNPEFILLDEPFNSIDIRAKDKIINYINSKYNSSTFLFVTHTIEDIPKLAGKIFLFKKNMLSGFKAIEFNKSEAPSTIIKNIFEELY